MIKFLQGFTVRKNKLGYYLVAVVVIGGFILVQGRSAISSMQEDETNANDQAHAFAAYAAALPNSSDHVPLAFDEEIALEARLEEFFSLVDGAGRVRVMISPFAGRETVFAMDKNMSESTSTEQDAQGGTRETRQYQTQEQTVMITDRQGTDRPLVVREVFPQVTGIVIIAEGGDNPFVQDALTRAARAVLGVEPHMVQVLAGR